MPRYKEMPMPPDQIMLFGQSVDEALAADSDVRSYNDVMECLEYSAFDSKRCSVGCPPYPPKELVKTLVYAYSKGIRSSRRIEELLKVDIRFIWLAGGLRPDHNTIARFRKDNWEELTSLFKDSVRVCAEAGLVDLAVVATDGTKIAAAASRKSIYGKYRLERELAAVDRILEEAEQVDAAEDEQCARKPAREIPEQLRDAKERRARLKEIADRLKESRKSTAVESDPDARVMLSGEGTRPAYNLQASVDSQSQVIVAMKLIQDEVDSGKLPEMVEQIQSNTGCSPGVSLADCGYCDEATMKWLDETKHNVLMPLRDSYRNARRTDPFASKNFVADRDRDVLICPAGRELSFRVEHWCGGATYRQYAANDCQSCCFYRQCVPNGRGSRRVNIRGTASQRDAMKEKLAGDEGKMLFKLRAQTVEPVFGQIKSNSGFDRLLTWGLNGARAETALACIAHNIRKCAATAAVAVLCWLAGMQAHITARPNRPLALAGWPTHMPSGHF